MLDFIVFIVNLLIISVVNRHPIVIDRNWM